MTSQRAAEICDGRTVYDGRRLLGFIVTKREGFEAVRAQGESLGRYNRELDAAHALFAAARQGSGSG